MKNFGLVWMLEFVAIIFTSTNFFSARIKSKPNEREIYKVQYFWFDHKTNWQLGRGKNWYGDCTRNAVLVAGFSLTNDNKLTTQTLRHIDFVLNND